MSKLSTYRFLSPAIALMVALALIGIFLDYQGQPLFWPGFFSMIFFYGIIFGIGLWAGKLRKSHSADDLMLAGRSIPLWIAVFTMSATWVGGGYINGTAESTSSLGLIWVQAPWGYALSLVVGGLLFARIMRKNNYKTMLDPFEQRYGKRVAALMFIPALSGELFWTAAILTALGTTFGTVLGVDFQTGLIISAAIAIIYTAIGGLWAVALTDVVQLLILGVGLMLVLPSAFETAGGFGLVWDEYFGREMPELGDAIFTWWDYALLLVFGGIPWQVYFQRVLSAKTPNTAMWLSIIAGGVCLIAAMPAVAIGMVGATFDWTAAGFPAPDDAALTLPYVVRYLTPPAIATIGLGAIAAAVMSSVDSSILSASSMASWNVYRPLIQPHITPENLSKVIKKTIWIIGIAATLIALQVKSVYTLWFLCSDLVYCMLFPQLLVCLYDKRANYIGAIAGFTVSFLIRMGSGEAVFGIPNLIPYPLEGAAGEVLFPFRTLAMLSGLITIMVVSRFFSPKKT